MIDAIYRRMRLESNLFNKLIENGEMDAPPISHQNRKYDSMKSRGRETSPDSIKSLYRLY